ncbi:hypothetical protein, conserved [Eimeria tenella]|uniref:Transmembrane protein n=1 Tax=Eimeria tenella TaxID=5802 RepID=U6KYU1_EIMTE|nr:hypothetical protein, conserved [Eimeria tenella]CDJ43131.1 hypothetical protein, conserved [Eimeria tenella]|eukprot:XP_013233881.1 hypothetical protein, conserved [Eimeria tenella]
MLGISRRRAFLACTATAILAQGLVCRSSVAAVSNSASTTPAQDNQQNSYATVATGRPHGYAPTPAFLEGKKPGFQVAALDNQHQDIASASIKSSTNTAEALQYEATGGPPPSQGLESSVFPDSAGHAEGQRPTAVAARRLLQGTVATVGPQKSPEHKFTAGVPHRRLQLLAGLSQLTQLPHLSPLPNLFGSGLSARDKDLLETFSRRVGTSRERLYRDLMFTTGAKNLGMDEFSMKQLVAKVGLENISTGHIPSSVHLSHQESRVLEAARRSHFGVERIIAAYEREVAQHAKTLLRGLEANVDNPAVRSKIASIASDNLFKRPRDVITVRRLQDSPRIRRLAALLQGPGLLGTASSLFRSMDPSSLSHSLSAGLGGLGLHHLNLPNIGALGHHSGSAQGPFAITDLSGLQQALQSIFPASQQVTAISGPLRSFQQGVETATDGAIGAFLSREGLLPFLSIDAAKQLLGGLLGGEVVGPNGLTDWKDLGLSPAAVSGLSAAMPFDTFLNKFTSLAQEVDSGVGIMKREAKKRIGAQGFAILPDQLNQVDNILDRLVWGTLNTPARRLQQTEAAEMALGEPTQQITPSEGSNQHQVPSPEEPKTKINPVADAGPPATEFAPQVTEAQVPPTSTPQHLATPPQQVQLPSSSQQEEQLQPVPDPAQAASNTEQSTLKPEQPRPDPEKTAPEQEQPSSELKTPSAGTEPVPDHAQQTTVEKSDDTQHQQQTAESSTAVDDLVNALLDENVGEEDPEDAINAALQRVELLADAVTVLLNEYERAVEHLQDLLDDQLDTAEEIREELEEQVKDLKSQVTAAQQTKQEGTATAAAEVAKAYDEAMESFKASLEGLLEKPQAEQPLSPALQGDISGLAAKIEAAAEEKLPPLVSAH